MRVTYGVCEALSFWVGRELSWPAPFCIGRGREGLIKGNRHCFQDLSSEEGREKVRSLRLGQALFADEAEGLANITGISWSGA
jgi:hypothetical protein